MDRKIVREIGWGMESQGWARVVGEVNGFGEVDRLGRAPDSGAADDLASLQKI
jgi:hypothetical protein